jgi:hypothetical protein
MCVKAKMLQRPGTQNVHMYITLMYFRVCKSEDASKARYLSQHAQNRIITDTRMHVRSYVYVHKPFALYSPEVGRDRHGFHKMLKAVLLLTHACMSAAMYTCMSNVPHVKRDICGFHNILETV